MSLRITANQKCCKKKKEIEGRGGEGKYTLDFNAFHNSLN